MSLHLFVVFVDTDVDGFNKLLMTWKKCFQYLESLRGRD
jgi:hypothetical protein